MVTLPAAHQSICFSDFCTPLSNHIPTLRDKWVSQACIFYSMCMRFFLLFKIIIIKNYSFLCQVRDRLDVSGSIRGLESSFQIIFFSRVAIQGTVRTEGKLQFGGEQGKPFWNCQELKQFGKRCRRKLPAWNDEMGALLQQKKLWLADYRLSDVDPSHAAFQMSPFTAASCTTESCM